MELRARSIRGRKVDKAAGIDKQDFNFKRFAQVVMNPSPVPPGGHLKIDSDGHVVEPPDLWLREMPVSLRDRGPRPMASDVMTSSNMTIDGKPVQRYPKESGGRIWTDETKSRYGKERSEGFSVASQLAGLDQEGIDAAVVFPTRGLPMMGAAGADPAVMTAAARVYNDWLVQFCASSHGRIFGAGMVDPRDVQGAVAEARRCASQVAIVGVFLRPNLINGLHWFDPVYEPLWSALEELDLPVCFHEGSSVALPQVGSDRYTEHAFWHTCNHPMEQQMAMLSMLMGGVAERHPKLRMAFLECGAGWLPYWLWRMDEHFENERAKLPQVKMRPSEYAERQCFVSIDSDETPGMAALELGSKPRVCWGSDYPHPDGKFPNALRTLASLPGMSPERFRSVVYDAPRELFGMRLFGQLKRPTQALRGRDE